MTSYMLGGTKTLDYSKWKKPALENSKGKECVRQCS